MEHSMFAIDFAFAAELIAAVAGVMLIYMGLEKTGFAKKLGLSVGWGVLSLSILTMICTTYYGTAYWAKGVYKPDRVAAMSTMTANFVSMPMMRQMWNCQSEGRAFEDCANQGMMQGMMQEMPGRMEGRHMMQPPSTEDADTH